MGELIIIGGPLAFGVVVLIWARRATRVRRAQKPHPRDQKERT
jgi:hypothetical protein